MAVPTLANWQARMGQDMRLADYRERRQEAYTLPLEIERASSTATTTSGDTRARRARQTS